MATSSKYPDNWKVTTLEVIASFITKGATPTTYGFDWVNKEIGIPFLRSECVTNNGFNKKGLNYISNEAHETMARSQIVSGDLLMTITGNIGRVAVLPSSIPEANINQHIAKISVKPEFNSQFVLQVLKQESYANYYARILTGQAYPQISLKQVRETPIAIPPKKEMNEIAAILSIIDEKIGLIDKNITQTEQLKMGLMQKLFSDGVGVQDKSGIWKKHTEFHKLGKINAPISWVRTEFGSQLAKIIGGGTPSKSNPDYWNGGIPWASVKDFKSSKLSASLIKDTITTAGVANSSTNLVEAGTIVIPTRMALGKVAITEDSVAINQDLKALYPSSSLDNKFLFYWLQSQAKKILRLGAGSTVAGIRLEVLKALDFVFPSNISEQQKIAEILSTVDEKLELLEQQRAEAKMLKKGLMQKLLTGEWRVPMDDSKAA